jgi:ATP-dependent protease ClpP protease subunit
MTRKRNRKRNRLINRGNLSDKKGDEPVQHKAQRECAERGLFLTSELNWETLEKLVPKIIALRLASSDPICLFIDSPGGNIHVAEELMKQIRIPNQDGESCLLTTVCIGTAASVAADLLASGDYAIGYKGCLVLCHGTRHTRSQITLEDVPRVAANIRADNERFALRLATAVFRRLVFLASMMPSEGEQQTLMKSVVTAPDRLLHKIKENLDSENQSLVELALKRQNKITEMIDHIDKKLSKKKAPTGLKMQAEILKQIVDYETRKNAANTQVFTSDHLLTIQEDFNQVKDYFSGQYRKRLSVVARQFGGVFLEPDEQKEYEKIPEADKGTRNKFLIEKTSPKLFPFWYLVVSLCRLLQESEYTFSAREALWFGLIDEAIGTNLPSLREYRESKEKTHESANQPSSTVPAQPALQSAPASAPKEPLA